MIAGTVKYVSNALSEPQNTLTINVLLNALVRQDTATIHVNLITDSHIITKNCDILQPSPSSDSAVPAHDRAFHPRMVLHLAVLQENTTLQPNAISDNHTRANGDIGANPAVLANLGCGVDQDVAAMDVPLACRNEHLRMVFGKR